MCPPAFKIWCRGDTCINFSQYLVFTILYMICETDLISKNPQNYVLMYDVGEGNLLNSLLTKVREKLNRTNKSLQRAIFDAFIRHWFDTGGNACDIFKMIRGDRIPESIKLSNVVAHNRLDSGQIPSAIFKSHNGIEVSTQVDTWSGQNTWIVV